MKVQKFRPSDAELVKSPGQDAEIFVGNLVDEKDGGPVTIGYGRYAPDQSLTETMAVHDTMIVLEGRLYVSTRDGTLTAGAQSVHQRDRHGLGAGRQGHFHQGAAGQPVGAGAPCQ